MIVVLTIAPGSTDPSWGNGHRKIPTAVNSVAMAMNGRPSSVGEPRTVTWSKEWSDRRGDWAATERFEERRPDRRAARRLQLMGPTCGWEPAARVRVVSGW